MVKKTFKLAEILELSQELNGNAKLQGILSLSMTMLTKFRLSKLNNELAKEVETYQKINDELIKKYGEERDGNYLIPNYLGDSETSEKKQNPNILKYLEELNPILLEEKEIEFNEVKIEDFQDVKIEGYYPIFFSKILIE